MRVVLLICCLFSAVAAEYSIGVGRADVTGPAVEVTFMGYAQVQQKGSGIHLRQYARAFIFGDGDDRIVFVTVDACMIGHGVRQKVLDNLVDHYGKLYTQKNVIISGTHSHSTPGGFLMNFLFDITSLGFVRQTFEALVSGITKSILRAHDAMEKGRIYISSGEILEASINRSPTAYANNPEEERNLYKHNVDKTIVQLRLVSSEEEKKGQLIGAINWFAVHPTSMNNTNTLISSDNVGYASLLLEHEVNSQNLTGRGPFVGAFASTNLGDVSPNTRGPRCVKSGAECDHLTSQCPGRYDPCIAFGPGVDMFDSTRIIATHMFSKAKELLSDDTTREVTGPLKIIHQYVDMPNQRIEVLNKETGEKEEVQGCWPAMGYSFAAGTTDGPGWMFGQGKLTENKLWNFVRDIVARPTEEDKLCHAPKPIFIATGRMKFPNDWQPHVVSTQLAFIGDVAIAAVPGEFTTMSGRRMREHVKQAILDNGGSDKVQVIVAGLSNVYSDYIATPEEYQIQRYEGASTIFGPHTLTIYLEQYKKLAAALMKDEVLPDGPTPQDISQHLLSFLPPVILDTAWRSKFGECRLQPAHLVGLGDEVRARFVAGNPRNNLMHEGTFLAIERKDVTSNWTVVATDSDWETKFRWHRRNPILGTSEAEIIWTIPAHAKPGEYRIRHFGYSKYLRGGTAPYEGVSNSFNVV